MSETYEFGNMHEIRGEVHVEWQIPEFLSLSANWVHSPFFFFSESCWFLRIDPNGIKDSPDRVALYLGRTDNGPPKTVSVSFGIKRADGVDKRWTNIIKLPSKDGNNTLLGTDCLISKSDLKQRRSQLMSSDALTIICTLTSVERHPTEVSLFNRFKTLSENLEILLEEKKGTDFTLKVGGTEFQAHRMILQSRSDYFATMLGNQFQENENNVSEIDDIEKDVFRCILTYLYTGGVKEMSSENVRKIYVAADKLLLGELKKICAYYMRGNLSNELIYDAVVIAKMYEESELEKDALEYFTRHADEIFESDEWKKFKGENQHLSQTLLETVIVQKIKNVKV